MVQDIASAYSMVSQTLATIKNPTRFAAVLAFVIRVPLNFLSLCVPMQSRSRRKP